MNDKPTRKELENKIAELKKQNEILQLHTSFHSEEEKVEDSEKYTHTILNNMGDPVFVKDDQSRLILVNDAFCEIFKLPRSEIIGKTLAENVTPKEQEIFLKIDNKVLSDGIESIDEESLTINGGQALIISTRKSRFINSNGKKFLVGVIRDITERKKAEVVLKESETRFKELNDTKDKLFSIIAHDLRSPLINILGISDLLFENVNDIGNTQSEKYIGIINSTTKNTLILLDNLLNWVKSQTGELGFRPEKTILSEIILEVIGFEKSLAKAKTISLHYTPTYEIELYTDVNILKTVLRNLISNAIKFTKLGGNINVLTTTKLNQVEISISDNGVGMNEVTIHKLFNISTNVTSRGTANEKGSGFGLVLCKEFVEKLGGHIWVESEEGKGSNFKFTLPLSISK